LSNTHHKSYDSRFGGHKQLRVDWQPDQNTFIPYFMESVHCALNRREMAITPSTRAAKIGLGKEKRK
jgi:hypothetical protein